MIGVEYHSLHSELLGNIHALTDSVIGYPVNKRVTAVDTYIQKSSMQGVLTSITVQITIEINPILHLLLIIQKIRKKEIVILKSGIIFL